MVIYAMSNSTDSDSWDEENELQWEQYNQIALPYAKNDLPRCHPSYRNQEIIIPAHRNRFQMHSAGKQSAGDVPTKEYISIDKLEAEKGNKPAPKEINTLLNTENNECGKNTIDEIQKIT